MQPVKNPCAKDCPDRSPTCHGECERYAAFAAHCERMRQARHQENIVAGAVFDAVQRCRKYAATRNQQHDG